MGRRFIYGSDSVQIARAEMVALLARDEHKLCATSISKALRNAEGGAEHRAAALADLESENMVQRYSVTGVGYSTTEGKHIRLTTAGWREAGNAPLHVFEEADK